MIIYPAVDIYDGKCVRLKEGKLEKMEMFMRILQMRQDGEKRCKALHNRSERSI